MLQNKTLGFLGSGNMATALIRGILNAQLATAKQIRISDIDAGKIEKLVAENGVVACANNLDLVRQCDIVILAVKPQIMNAVLAEIAPEVCGERCFISIAAGVTLKRLENALGPHARVIRVMPNTPALIGVGAAAIARGGVATERDVVLAKGIFEAVGVAIVLDEKYMDAVTAVSGSGPAYLFFFVEALLAAAERVGLDREVAQALVKQTVLGAARMVMEAGQPPDKLREAVTSPGGTTAAALAVLREGGFADLVARAIGAAAARSVELGKG